LADQPILDEVETIKAIPRPGYKPDPPVIRVKSPWFDTSACPILVERILAGSAFVFDFSGTNVVPVEIFRGVPFSLYPTAG
jgi:hypothetical protein